MLFRSWAYYFKISEEIWWNYDEGSLAQLVKSICLTSRGSGVRTPQLPLKGRPHRMLPVLCKLTFTYFSRSLQTSFMLDILPNLSRRDWGSIFQNTQDTPQNLKIGQSSTSKRSRQNLWLINVKEKWKPGKANQKFSNSFEAQLVQSIPPRREGRGFEPLSSHLKDVHTGCSPFCASLLLHTVLAVRRQVLCWSYYRTSPGEIEETSFGTLRIHLKI